MNRTGATPGRLLLVPNTLDLGADETPLQQVLPQGVVEQAARLTHWAVEDARSARAFLKRVSALSPLARPLQELQITELPRARKGSGEAVPAAAWMGLLQPALDGQDLGLLSEAGLPAVADPGAHLVAAAHVAGLRVLPLAGPSSLLLALAASGLDGQSFAFVGYLPQEPSARLAALKALEATSRRLKQTQILIETPYRNEALLASALKALAPGTRLSISCGLTLPDGFSRTDRVKGWQTRPQMLPTKVPAVFLLLAD
jgi:16S rRNA (cytidine1402-2'-O)-methyltransferase